MEVIALENKKTYKDFNLTKSQGLYCEYRVQGLTKRYAYAKAFGYKETNEELQRANEMCWQLHKKYGDKINAYIEYLESLHHNEFITNLRQLQEQWLNIATDENVKMKDRLKAYEMLAKSMGAFNENINIKADIKQVLFQGEEEIAD